MIPSTFWSIYLFLLIFILNDPLSMSMSCIQIDHVTLTTHFMDIGELLLEFFEAI